MCCRVVKSVVELSKIFRDRWKIWKIIRKIASNRWKISENAKNRRKSVEKLGSFQECRQYNANVG